MGLSTFECTYVNYIELGGHKHCITTLLGCVTQKWQIIISIGQDISFFDILALLCVSIKDKIKLFKTTNYSEYTFISFSNFSE